MVKIIGEDEWITSTGGSLSAVYDATCFDKALNFGRKALAAGPPSTPNSLNLYKGNKMVA